MTSDKCSTAFSKSEVIQWIRHVDQICKRAVENPVSATDPDMYADFPGNVSNNELSQASSVEQEPQNRRYPLRTKRPQTV